jgi:hypothetical protein
MTLTPPLVNRLAPTVSAAALYYRKAVEMG